MPEYWIFEGETVDGDLIYKDIDGCNVTAAKYYAKKFLKEVGGGHIDILWNGDFVSCFVEV